MLQMSSLAYDIILGNAPETYMVITIVIVYFFKVILKIRALSCCFGDKEVAQITTIHLHCEKQLAAKEKDELCQLARKI